MVKSIFLQDGEEIFVDDEDYERVNQYTWTKSYYRDLTKVSNKKVGSLSNFIINDHVQKYKNNDFTKRNLIKKSVLSKRGCRNTSSIYKGVSWCKTKNKWRAYITIQKKRKHLGYFNYETQAAIAYNKAVLKFANGEGYMNVLGKNNNVIEDEYKSPKFQNITRRTSGKFKGVRYHKRDKLYYSTLYINNKLFYIGANKNKDKAALMYNKSIQYIDSDAILNDVPMTDELKEFIDNWEIPERIKALKEGADNE
ncbi:AP2/ERF family transcription factor [Staphylococcus haemolyticus]|uniref:AP2/ERF domain-containing protein n=1 Tax=Staphylococcus haemolyticus (strain JCSC1435) TaxID=279808 RepID=Q4L3T8_STAHJ|nr:AP2/ERF family transcription factor [Staphylococcus haemolyticus]BAE05689.1 unnamed protein product [Staphylococcus haemolyticus JCSC1435]